MEQIEPRRAVGVLIVAGKGFRPPQVSRSEEEAVPLCFDRREWFCDFRDHRRSSGLSLCRLRLSCHRWKWLSVRVLIVVSVLFEFQEYYSHCVLVSDVVIGIRHRCRLRWLLGCHQTGSETVAVFGSAVSPSVRVVEIMEEASGAELLVSVISS
ncbi:uncharacterized protein DS421_2g49370 [Arachis hypogaea]|nr:uncharacterized protein DS421_2g49370 [Arachis hypogaea]